MDEASGPTAASEGPTYITRRGSDLGADVDDLMRVYAAAGGPNGEDLRARREIVERHTTYADAVGVLALTDHLVGFVYGARTEPGQWWHDHVDAALPADRRDRWLRDAFVVCEFAVLPDERGHGIGSTLLDRLLHRPEVERHRVVLLSAEMTNPVERLYRRLGFEDIITSMPFAPDGLPYRIMGRQTPV